ncbi:MAG: phosphomannose isomerase type II C-terminal cupin domain [Clostridiales bacterium]|nr:phosphomannose isomerase type II C-terminal cupin domain [Clostridiales bacterium]
MENKTIIKSVSENPQPLTIKKDWGSYTVLHEEKDNLTILVTLTEGSRMKYHSHSGRRELWVVASGTGRVIMNEEERLIRTGDVVQIPREVRHTVIASSELKLIEVQIGDTSATDKTVYDLRQDYYSDGSTGYSIG